MTLIRKPQELVLQPKIKMLMYGQAGTGKTTLALSAPNPLLIDCDRGIHRVNIAHHTDTVQVDKYEDILQVLVEDLSAYESIVIDTGGKLLDFMAEYIIKRNSKMGRANGMLTLQGFGERKMEFNAFCKKVSMLNKHLVFVAHRDTRTEGDDIRYIPLFGGSSYDSLVSDLDLVLYLEAQGRNRILTADPTSRNEGKNTCNLPAQMSVPLVVDEQGNGLSNTFLQTGIIKPYTDRLAQAVENRKKYTALIEELKTAVEEVTDCMSINDLVARGGNFDHIGNSSAVLKQLIVRKAAQLNLIFNKSTKKYEPAGN